MKHPSRRCPSPRECDGPQKDSLLVGDDHRRRRRRSVEFEQNLRNFNKLENSRKMVAAPARRGGRVPFVKYFIFGFNVIFVVIGFAIAALGIWLKVDDRFREFLSQRYRQVVTDATWDAPTLYAFAYVLIALGCVMILVAFFGCCGSILENTCLLVAYFVCLMVLFAVTLGCGIFLFIKRDSIQNEVGDALTYMVQHYYQGAGVLQQAMDALQQAFRCCGNSGCGDYRDLRLDVPRSCDISCDGCRHRMYRALRDGFTITTVIFIIVLLAELFGIALSMYLFCLLTRTRKDNLYYGPQSKILREAPPPAGYPTLSMKTQSPSPLGDQQQQQQQQHQNAYQTKQMAFHRSSPEQPVKMTVLQGADRSYQYNQAPPRPPPPYHVGDRSQQWKFAHQEPRYAR